MSAAEEVVISTTEIADSLLTRELEIKANIGDRVLRPSSVASSTL